MSHDCFLRTAADFQRVLRSRRSRASRDGWCLYCDDRRPPRLESAPPRLGVIVSKRHARSSVQRNRIRRVLREYFRTELRFLLPPADYLLRAISVQPRQADARQLRDSFRFLLAAPLNKGGKRGGQGEQIVGDIVRQGR